MAERRAHRPEDGDEQHHRREPEHRVGRRQVLEHEAGGERAQRDRPPRQEHLDALDAAEQPVGDHRELVGAEHHVPRRPREGHEPEQRAERDRRDRERHQRQDRRPEPVHPDHDADGRQPAAQPGREDRAGQPSERLQ